MRLLLKLLVKVLFGGLVLLALGGAIYYWVVSRDDCQSLADDPVRWHQVLEGWRKQELVLMIRHASKCDGDHPDCPTDDEYLTEQGKLEAALIGKGLKLLEEDFVAYHSPMTRTRDTARIALGDRSQPRGWLSTACKTDFPDYFYDLPSGSNYLLVTHSSCFDVFEKPGGGFLLGFDSGTRFHFGIAAFFKRFQDDQGHNQPGLMGCIWPEDWEDLAALGSSPRE